MTAHKSMEQRFGDTVMWFEEPDTLAFEIRGDVTEELASAVMVQQAVIAAGRPYLFLLVDMSGYKSVSPAARRIIGEKATQMPPLVSVYFGMSFQARVMAKLVMAALNVLGREPHRHRFCGSEAKARAYLAGLRPSMASRT